MPEKRRSTLNVLVVVILVFQLVGFLDKSYGDVTLTGKGMLKQQNIIRL